MVKYIYQIELGNILLITGISLITFILANLYCKQFEKYKELKVRTKYTLILYTNKISNQIDLADITDKKLP